MAVEPIPIKVKLEITAGNEKPVAELVEIKVEGLCITPVELKAGGDKAAPVEVPVMPEIHPDEFKFLLIRPAAVGGEPIKPGQIDGLKLWYSTHADPANRQRKPLRGPHVFHSGQTEWITDLLGGNKPGPLKVLYFWNNSDIPGDLTDKEKEALRTDEEKKKAQDKKKVSKDVSLQIITGYIPKPN